MVFFWCLCRNNIRLRLKILIIFTISYKWKSMVSTLFYCAHGCRGLKLSHRDTTLLHRFIVLVHISAGAKSGGSSTDHDHQCLTAKFNYVSKQITIQTESLRSWSWYWIIIHNTHQFMHLAKCKILHVLTKQMHIVPWSWFEYYRGVSQNALVMMTVHFIYLQIENNS